jgi:hypothetical protein
MTDPMLVTLYVSTKPGVVGPHIHADGDCNDRDDEYLVVFLPDEELAHINIDWLCLKCALSLLGWTRDPRDS